MALRRIVLDANILVRAVLGMRVPELIARYTGEVSFFAPEVAFAEAARNLPIIAHKRGTDPGPLLEALDRFSVVVTKISDEVIAPLERAAMARIGGRDPMDWLL